MSDFRKLEVWRKAHELALASIRISAKLRGAHNTTLKGQLIRAAMSVPTNIAEGSARGSDKEFARFLRISIGSITEVEYHLILACDLASIQQDDFEALEAQVHEVRKMLSGLVRRLDPPPM